MALDEARGTVRLCVRCTHFRPPRRIQLFDADELHSVGAMEAQNKWDEERREQAVQEMQRAEARHPFDYEPQHYAWCARYTQVDLVERARGGDDRLMNEVLESGAATINPVTGELKPLYELCLWHNAEGDCELYSPRP